MAREIETVVVVFIPYHIQCTEVFLEGLKLVVLNVLVFFCLQSSGLGQSLVGRVGSRVWGRKPTSGVGVEDGCFVLVVAPHERWT